MIVLALTILPSSSSATASSTGITLTRMSSPSPAKPVQAAGAFAVHPPAEQAHRLGARAGAREERRDGDEIGHGAARFLVRFAPRHLFGGLPRLDDSGHALQEPGVPARGPRAGAELLDEDDAVAGGVHGKHRGHPAAFQDLAREHRPEAARELPVA